MQRVLKIRNSKLVITMQVLFRFALSMLLLSVAIGTGSRAFAITWPFTAVEGVSLSGLILDVSPE
jgi:FtsH-binding integral membrane protein